MTRPLRKQHLILWLFLVVIVGLLMAYGRNNTPVFSGDHPDVIHQR